MIRIIVGVCVVFALAWWVVVEEGVEGPMPGGGGTEGRASSRASDASFTVSEVAFHRAAGLERFWRIEPGRHSISFLTYEDISGTGSTAFHEFERATAYRISEVAPRSAIDVFIQGVPRAGGFVIERWHLNEVLGSRSADIVSNGTPVGTPSLFTASQNQSYIVGGGAQIPVSERTVVSPMRRLEFASDATVDCAAIGADPEGRFVLVLTDTGDLRQYPADPGDGSYSLVADAMSQPSLLHVEGLMWRAQHSIHGRVWFIAQSKVVAQTGAILTPDAWGWVVLHDLENDGLFEAIEWRSFDDPFVEGLLDRSLWVSDFASF